MSLGFRAADAHGFHEMKGTWMWARELHAFAHAFALEGFDGVVPSGFSKVACRLFRL